MQRHSAFSAIRRRHLIACVLALFLYAYLAERLWHPTALMLVLMILHAGFCYQALSGASA